MCGIVGFWDLKKKYRSEEILKIINSMAETLKHRGPDDKGSWISKDKNLAFGHRRLSIIEPNDLGKQPMISQNNRFIIIFNGEIYNFLDLKKELEIEGVNFESNSDTNILLEACSNWGMKKTLQKVSGMFAFALWDKKNKELYLARDRFGIKPLYYSLSNSLLLFSSQTKSFIKHTRWKKELCYKALNSYFQYGYIPSNQSIFKNTLQILPGHFLIFSSNGRYEVQCYWNINKIAKKYKNIETAINLEPKDIENRIENYIEDSVEKHMVSDVPLGSFLSGGIDSSLITALMQKKSLNPIKTFNIGFQDKLLDESSYATSVAKHLGTEHHKVIFNNKDLLEFIPKISDVYDEPFADSSQLPTILLSKITSKKVKVVLSGDGGDELFSGYNRYHWVNKIKYFYLLPKKIRNILSGSMKIFSPNQWDNIFSYLPKLKKYSSPGDKMYKLSDSLNLNSISELYSYFVSQWKEDEIPLKKKFLSSQNYYFNNINFLDIKEQMQIMDMQTYLVDDILTKVDRASMFYGLEVRVPFLEENIAKYIWHYNFLSKNKDSKHYLKKILYKYVPKKLVNRPKMGFAIPLEKWLKGSLRNWAENLLEKKKLEDGYLNPTTIINKWNEHISGKRNWQYPIWTILIYQSWKERNKI